MPELSVRADSVNVEEIMRQIRARVKEKRGADYTEDEIKELASVKLERFLDPLAVRSGLLDEYRTKRSVTTIEPGPSEVLTHGLTRKPFSTAFFASSPAATITEGFEVFVQLVIAAITTEPSLSVAFSPSISISAVFGPSLSRPRKAFFMSGRLMRSCGRFGPASEGTTVERSSAMVSE